MKEYLIWDSNWGLFSQDEVIDAKNPKEAMQKLGYKDIERKNDGSGNIVVRTSSRNGRHGFSYTYKALKTEEEAEK